MGFLKTLLAGLGDGSLGAWIVAIAGVMGALAHITALTPTPKDDAILGKIQKFVDLIAGNYGSAKNGK